MSTNRARSGGPGRRSFLKLLASAIASAWMLAHTRFARPAQAQPLNKKDIWHDQKELITTKDEFGEWVDNVVAELEAYRDSLGDSGSEQNVKAAVTTVITNLPGTKSLDLDDAKKLADQYLLKIKVIQAAASLWVTGAGLYFYLIRLILTRLAGGGGGIPWEAINKTLEFMIEGLNKVDKEAAKELKAIKKLKEAVEKGKETIEKLTEALQEFLRNHSKEH